MNEGQGQERARDGAKASREIMTNLSLSLDCFLATLQLKHTNGPILTLTRLLSC